ncbi:MAG TPA: hypothetical protein DEE98_00800 [Elusimicrobia bacterium]|nr:MAG: hypothetical protein A2278_03425 [Elusimicrobia bacterium RIFOXYA12_FULL_49_49]OGS09990.1 MAG: hypothetical protein A2204_01425 [Elusimicrobia bacterium RIFOXYA1_FULL_47_7]OGS11773.1 MAG: hypothetical protein A2386_07265 [Elusimicrobia bacterium RIFOXYB1_FULL_48_9]OGS15611.1 MAG: hypothetical protein A2251_03675 [Elusimicrobia bacterium RIFOXYA2_FULL_47_53]OGS26834.1 MAG: hypothetical protein A2339_07305 [Elusimicrobia bacterium RIFOXYB12_FULL_50_12]OGS30710.1 MAG: hypothetical protein
MLKYIYGLIILSAVMFFYVWQQTQSVRLGYTVDSLKTECERLEQENKDWHLKINRLISMEKLDKVAAERQLSAPEEKDILYLR